MTTKLYVQTDKSTSADLIELPTYFHENLTFDVNNIKMRFASQQQVEDLKRMAVTKLKEQKAKLENWITLDQDINLDAFFDFVQPSQNKDNDQHFQVFNCGGPVTEKSLEQGRLEERVWRVENLNSLAGVSGCDLSHRMAKVAKQVNLRSKAFTMNLNFILLGESSLNVITRSKHDNEETTVIKFMKTGVGAEQRLFLYFGILDMPGKDIVYTKRTEVPVLLTDENQIKNNYVEVSCSIHDNGDQFLIVSGEVNYASKYHFKAKYEQIVPYFEDFHVYLYGERQSVVLKKLRLKLIQRKDLNLIESEKVPNQDCCSMF